MQNRPLSTKPSYFNKHPYELSFVFNITLMNKVHCCHLRIMYTFKLFVYIQSTVEKGKLVICNASLIAQ